MQQNGTLLVLSTTLSYALSKKQAQNTRYQKAQIFAKNRIY